MQEDKVAITAVSYYYDRISLFQLILCAQKGLIQVCQKCQSGTAWLALHPMATEQ